MKRCLLKKTPTGETHSEARNTNPKQNLCLVLILKVQFTGPHQIMFLDVPAFIQILPRPHRHHYLEEDSTLLYVYKCFLAGCVAMLVFVDRDPALGVKIKHTLSKKKHKDFGLFGKPQHPEASAELTT